MLDHVVGSPCFDCAWLLIHFAVSSKLPLDSKLGAEVLDQLP